MAALSPALPRRAATAVATLLTLFAWLAAAAPAGAHAVLEGGSVRDGDVLAVAPEEVALVFNEPVQTTAGGLRVYDRAGERVDEGGTFQPPDDPATIRVALRDGLDDGTYAVTYRVISADSHPVGGALLFSVGTPARDGDALLAQVFAEGGDRPWAAAAAVTRWLIYLGVLLAAGAAATVWWLRREVEAPEAAWVAAQVRTAALVVLGATVVGVLLQTVLVAGDGWRSVLDGGSLAGTMTSTYGVAAVVRVVGLALLLAGLARGGRLGGMALASPLALVGGATALASLLLEGHTMTTGPAAVVWPAAVVHVATAALWGGGLVVLWHVLRSRRRADDPVGAGRLVARASSAFTLSVVLVVLAGLALSWVEVRALRAVLTTDYGLVLVAKVVAVLPLLALGLWNNRRLVPVLAARRGRRARAPQARPVVAGGSDELADRARARDDAWASLRRVVRVEVALIAVVLGITAVLVSLQPAAVAAGVTGAYSDQVPMEGVGQLSITVDPNRAGQNEIHLYLLGDTGRPVDVDGEVTVTLVQPDLEIGPLERTPTYAGPGHHILAGSELNAPGRWVITVSTPLNRFDTAEATVEVTVNP